jgi:hypothetical protein
MKKTTKKLVLTKETVRSLNAPGLLGVAGATALQTDCATACTQPAPQTYTCLCEPNPSISCGWTCNCVSNYVICPPPIQTDVC